jgi:5-methylcytosine-specific restriction enzyme subunit McrC
MTHLTVSEWGRRTVGEGGFTRAQANALLVAARAHPLGGRDGTEILCDHHTFLRARQMVGVLAAPGCSLEILPKVDPEAHDEAAPTVRWRLVHMLDVALGLGLSVGQSMAMAREAQSLLEVFIAAFADRLLAEVRRGLPRQYLACQEDLPALRGRLDAVRQFTANAVRPDRLACRFDALESDGPLLQVMKACVLLVERHARGAETRRKLAELRFLLAEVRDVPRGALPWRQVRIDRTSQRWRALLDLARLLLGGEWQQTHADARGAEGITLLFAMNDLFERYVAVQLRRALAGTRLDVVAQGGFRYALGPWREGQDCVGNSHSTRPDILIRRGDQVACVIDTKWKRFADGIAQSDVYQMIAYARLYRCDRLVLLYPAVPGEVAADLHPRGMAQGTERLDISRIALGKPGPDVQQGLRRLVGGLLKEPAISGAPAQH